MAERRIADRRKTEPPGTPTEPGPPTDAQDPTLLSTEPATTADATGPGEAAAAEDDELFR